MYDMLLQVFDWMDRSPFAAFLGAWLLLSVLLVPVWGRVTRRPRVKGLDGQDYRVPR